METEAAIERARQACADAVSRLREARAPLEQLAEYVPARRVMLIPRPATMRDIGEVWRIAPLLLGADGTLHRVGRVTRAAERPRRSHHAQSQEERRDIAAAALRGGYPAGTSVNYDATPITLDTAALAAAGAEPGDPIIFAAGEVRVRWFAGAPLADAPTLARFLDERVGLIIEAMRQETT